MATALSNNTRIEVVDTVDSYAVFATKNIKAGDIVEEFVFRQTPWRTHELDSRSGFLHTNALISHCGCGTCRQYGSHFIQPLGNVSVYTHSVSPNADIRLPEDKDIRPRNSMIFGVVVATADISKGDMVTINVSLHYSPKKVRPELIVENEARLEAEAAEMMRQVNQEVEV